MLETSKNILSDSKDIDTNKRNFLKDPVKNDESIQKYLKEINGIEVLEFIDSGSESNVYHISFSSKNSYQQKEKKNAIMKLILDKRKSKNNEIYISRILKNKNIIDCYTSVLDKENLSFLIMEYAKYGNLRNFNQKILKRTYFSESLICFLAYQILNGIKYMHICKIAHMDIKPHNIVIDQYLNAKIIDFSISLNYKKKPPESYIKLPFVGTNFYMSKEILKKEKIKVKDLHKVDLYSFGVMLYNLAFASYPYGLEKEDADNYATILEKIETNELSFPNTEDYSPHFLDFIRKLLEKDIEKRMKMSEALEHYWIKGGKLLLNEQEKIYNAGIFLSYLLTDHISDFNEYISKRL